MAWRLRTSHGKQLYGLRKQTLEPVFGIIKSMIGFRQFLLRGLDRVCGEWSLARIGHSRAETAKVKELRSKEVE